MKKIIIVIISVFYLLLLIVPFYTDFGYRPERFIDENGNEITQTVKCYYKRNALQRLSANTVIEITVLAISCINILLALIALFNNNPALAKIRNIFFVVTTLVMAFALLLAKAQTMKY